MDAGEALQLQDFTGLFNSRHVALTHIHVAERGRERERDFRTIKQTMVDRAIVLKGAFKFVPVHKNHKQMKNSQKRERCEVKAISELNDSFSESIHM